MFLVICLDEFADVFSSVPFCLFSFSTCFMNNFIQYWGARTTQMSVCHKACFSKLLEHFFLNYAVCNWNYFWMIVIKFIFDMSVDPVIMSTPEKKWYICSATEDLFSDTAFNAVAPLTPHIGHIWKQTNKQVLLVSDFLYLHFVLKVEKSWLVVSVWLLNLHTKVQSSADFTKCSTILLTSLMFGSHIKGQRALLSQGSRDSILIDVCS